MNANANLCFDAIARDTRWHSFTAVEQLILDDFTCRWAIKPGENVLEPGCGSGRLTAVLAELTWPGGSVVAFDASAEFISVASGRGLPPHVRLPVAQALFAPRAGGGQIVARQQRHPARAEMV